MMNLQFFFKLSICRHKPTRSRLLFKMLKYSCIILVIKTNHCFNLASSERKKMLHLYFRDLFYLYSFYTMINGTAVL